MAPTNQRAIPIALIAIAVALIGVRVILYLESVR